MFISDKEIATATTVVFSFYSIGFVEQSITVTITPSKIVYRIEELKLIESATNEMMIDDYEIDEDNDKVSFVIPEQEGKYFFIGIKFRSNFHSTNKLLVIKNNIELEKTNLYLPKENTNIDQMFDKIAEEIKKSKEIEDNNKIDIHSASTKSGNSSCNYCF